MQNFIKQRAAVGENNTVRRYRADGKNANGTAVT